VNKDLKVEMSQLRVLPQVPSVPREILNEMGDA